MHKPTLSSSSPDLEELKLSEKSSLAEKHDLNDEKAKEASYSDSDKLQHIHEKIETMTKDIIELKQSLNEVLFSCTHLNTIQKTNYETEYPNICKRQKIVEFDQFEQNNSQESTLHAQSECTPTRKNTNTLMNYCFDSQLTHIQKSQTFQPNRLYKPIPLPSLNVTTSQLMNC